jgi:undecaprenyl-diphosphatase
VTTRLQKLLELDALYSRRLSIAERPGFLRSLAAILAHSGDSWFWLAGLAALWWLGSDYWKTRAVVLVAGIVLTAVLVLLVKFTVRRRRPEGEWGAIYRTTDPHSFPSGHAARATMLAVVALGLGPAWLGILLLIWAPLVILARVAMGVHYLSDVIAGAAFGVVMGLVTFPFLFYGLHLYF